MGIYDRDYYREERPGVSLRGPRSMVGALILINVAVYIVCAFTEPIVSSTSGQVVSYWLTDMLAASVGTLTKPWLWWQFLTCGFAHDVKLGHIAFNMFGLWILGRDVESRYGSAEFLRLYLVLIVTGSVLWAVAGKLNGNPDNYSVIGASGAVVGVVVLYALNFPRRTLLLFFVLPVRAWVAGLILVAVDVHGAIMRPDSGIAYSVHLTGAAVAFLYFRFGWNFGRLTGDRFRLPKRRPNLKIHDPEDKPDRRQEELSDEVDRILGKIHQEGEASLTRKERRTLENASRQYQKKRQVPDDR